MAINIDSSANGTIGSASTSVTYAITVTGSDTIGHTFVTQQSDASTNRITGVTWNGTAMSLETTYKNTANDSLYMWMLVGVTTGNIVVTRDTTGNTGWCSSQSHTGAKQTGQPDSEATGNTTSSTTLTTTTTTVADNCWTILGVFDSDGGLITASTNSTLRNTVTDFVKTFDNNGDITPAGAYSMTVTFTSSATSPKSSIIHSIAPAPVTSAIKTVNGLAKASVKTVNGLAIASVKTINGLA